MLVSIYKSFPSWSYLLFGYYITKDNRTKEKLLLTILYAVILSVPITLLTTPVDVIKSQRQALLCSIEESNLKSAIRLKNKYGIVSLYRGFEFRLLHKSLAT